LSGSHKIEEVWGLVYEVGGAWADDSAHKCLSTPPTALQAKRRPLTQGFRLAFLDIDLVKEGNLMHEPMDEWTFESRIYSEFVC
jgi:hypothetical protein